MKKLFVYLCSSILTFKPCAKKLKDTLKELSLSDSEHYNRMVLEGE